MRECVRVGCEHPPHSWRRGWGDVRLVGPATRGRATQQTQGELKRLGESSHEWGGRQLANACLQCRASFRVSGEAAS